ncbi:tyrosine-protein phosphatase [Sphingomonas sp. XXL09]|uniref:tyrosine-protein phosphatase n=1 Tax=Sphingomonas sp. XXL09 TaxID=3457787 RepID=UPI00406BDA9C
MRHLATAFALLAAVAGVVDARPGPSAPNAHERLVALQGGQNFRDLGGYRTADGRIVKWGLLYRSGAMNALTPADFATLAQHGLRTVCDLRDTRERTKAPVNWPTGHAPAVFADDYDMSGAMRELADPALDGAKARALMQRTYADLPFRFAGQYRRMFAELAAGHAPLAVNCSAGKDRTGVAAALLLTVLGVPRATVMQDYLLSNRYFDPARAAAQDPNTAAFTQRLPADAVKALMDVEPAYLDAAFAAIAARPGGLAAYQRDQLGLDPATVRRLRDRYLTRG